MDFNPDCENCDRGREAISPCPCGCGMWLCRRCIRSVGGRRVKKPRLPLWMIGALIVPSDEFYVPQVPEEDQAAWVEQFEPAPMVEVNTERLYATTNASVWAEEFAKVHPEINQGTMIAWFANAIETAKHLSHSGRAAVSPSGDAQ